MGHLVRLEALGRAHPRPWHSDAAAAAPAEVLLLRRLVALAASGACADTRVCAFLFAV